MLTRKDLRDMGITDEEQITAIINRHKGEIEDLKEAHKAAKTVEPKPAASSPPAEKKPAPKGDAPDELEQLRRELEAEKQKSAAREKRDAILEALKAHNPKNASLLLAQVNQEKVIIQDGKVLSGLDEQVAPLKETDGYLFTDTADDKGGTAPSGSGGAPVSMNDIIRGGT